MADFLNRKYGEGTVKLTLKDQYYNMREMVEPHPQVIAKAEQAMRMAGVEPLVKPIRGGTDGSRLSYMGLPWLRNGRHVRFIYPSIKNNRLSE